MRTVVGAQPGIIDVPGLGTCISRLFPAIDPAGPIPDRPVLIRIWPPRTCALPGTGATRIMVALFAAGVVTGAILTS
jgi:hypothetical protein